MPALRWVLLQTVLGQITGAERGVATPPLTKPASIFGPPRAGASEDSHPETLRPDHRRGTTILFPRAITRIRGSLVRMACRLSSQVDFEQPPSGENVWRRSFYGGCGRLACGLDGTAEQTHLWRLGCSSSRFIAGISALATPQARETCQITCRCKQRRRAGKSTNASMRRPMAGL